MPEIQRNFNITCPKAWAYHLLRCESSAHWDLGGVLITLFAFCFKTGTQLESLRPSGLRDRSGVKAF